MAEKDYIKQLINISDRPCRSTGAYKLPGKHDIGAKTVLPPLSCLCIAVKLTAIEKYRFSLEQDGDVCPLPGPPPLPGKRKKTPAPCASEMAPGHAPILQDCLYNTVSETCQCPETGFSLI